MGYATDLPKALAARGLTVELVPGWETRGSPNFAPFGALAHWTAGPRAGDRPSLNVVVNGRPGLPGPLAQVFGARNGNAIVVSANRANHAGAGYYQGADGNTDLFGCEMEWSGTPGELTPAQRWAYPRIMAAFMDLGAKFIAGHDEYALPRGRKVDVGAYINTLRAQTAAIVTAGTTTDPSEEDDMKILATYQGKIYVGDGITRRHIETPTVLADLKWHYDQAGIRYQDAGKVDRIEFLGKELLDKADGDTLRRTAKAAADNTGPITRGGKPVPLRQEVADIKTILLDQNKGA